MRLDPPNDMCPFCGVATGDLAGEANGDFPADSCIKWDMPTPKIKENPTQKGKDLPKIELSTHHRNCCQEWINANQ
jgi:hypothetical protein